jgi:hypothetical protein
MSQSVKNILQRVENWSAEDQEELAQVAREIEARRSGVYVWIIARKLPFARASRSWTAATGWMKRQ